MMLRNKAFGLFIALTTAGCISPSAPSRIENGRYKDYDRQFSFATPQSWRQIEGIPADFLPNRNSHEAQYTKSFCRDSALIFVNANGTGIIAITIEQCPIDASKLQPAEIQKIVEDVRRAREQTLVKAFQISNYQLSATPGFITEKPLSLFKEQFRYSNQKEFALESEFFVFMANNRTCSVRATLFSQKPALVENRLTFNQVLKTLTRENPRVIVKQPLSNQASS